MTSYARDPRLQSAVRQVIYMADLDHMLATELCGAPLWLEELGAFYNRVAWSSNYSGLIRRVGRRLATSMDLQDQLEMLSRLGAPAAIVNEWIIRHDTLPPNAWASAARLHPKRLAPGKP